MKTHFLFLLLLLILASCGKNPTQPQLIQEYHIDEADTISAVYIATAFTTNGDGFNDSWHVWGTPDAWSDFHLQIFDNAGGVLFESTSSDASWDGTHGGQLLPADQYQVKLDIRDTTGHQFNLDFSIALMN